MDTIFALATARGRSGVAVIRISGPEAFAAGTRLTGLVDLSRKAALASIRDASGELIDTGLVLGFRGPGSFTGEDVVELQVHGSVAVVSALLEELSGHDRLRVAEPGEFTQRAFLNGKMDLSEVEALADLIDADTEVQRQRAIAQMSGKLRELVGQIRADLIRARALLEAKMEFADEEIPQSVDGEVLDLLNGVAGGLQHQLSGFGASERIRSGFEVAILGEPNVGKSSLMNALAGRDAALTSNVAGTTRDVIEVRMDLGGLPVTFLDTAGLRETSDEVEAMGIARAMERAAAADLRVLLLGEDRAFRPAGLKMDVIVQGKADLGWTGDIAISAINGDGIGALVSHIGGLLEDRAADASMITRPRHRQKISHALGALSEATAHMKSGHDELACRLLDEAGISLSEVVGGIGIESVYDEIFSSFCIGK